MQVTVNDLRNKLKSFDKLPNSIKNMGFGDYLVVYYNYITDEENDIKVKALELVNTINMFVLANKSKYDAQNVGYFKQSFDTRDILFYFFLKSFIGKDEAKEFIMWAKRQDSEAEATESVAQSQKTFVIENRSDFENAINKFLFKKPLLQGIMMAYDMVDNLSRNEYNESIYGKITKVVELLKQTGRGKNGEVEDMFLITEQNGKVRYLIVGENSTTGKKDEMLPKAKEMFRLKYSMNTILNDTGWFYNKYDGRWRKYISDAKARLKESEGKMIEDGIMYYPQDCPYSADDLYETIFAKRTNAYQKLIKNGYNGILGDFLDHPELYKNYPELYRLPLFYYRAIEETRNYDFHFNPSEPKYIVINSGFCDEKETFTVILHEIQHYIQNYENFGSGGNVNFLAKVLTAVGGSNLRKFALNQRTISDSFCSNITESIYESFKKDYNNIIDILDDDTTEYIDNSLESYDKFVKDGSGVISKIIYFIVLVKDGLVAGKVKEFISNYLTSKDIQCISFIQQAIEETSNDSKNLSAQGLTDSNIYGLYFSAYLNLAGELESRTVQHLAFVDEDLLNYFTPYSAETVEDYDVNVLYDKTTTPFAQRKIEAGIEWIEESDKYILHFSQSLTSIQFLHELGHIVYDFAKKKQVNGLINQVYLSKYMDNYSDDEEYFCDYFLSFLCRKNLTEQLTVNLDKFKDMEIESSIENILLSFFTSKAGETLVSAEKKEEEIKIYLAKLQGAAGYPIDKQSESEPISIP